jgi:hypothetical protein
MMNVCHLSVAVTTESLAMAAGRSITGRIWLKLEGRDFPERDWFDFPVALLNSWIEEISKLSYAENQTGFLHFMDGPFMITMKARSATLASASFIRSGQVLCEASVSVDEFSRSVKMAGRLVAEACIARGWSDEEIMKLDAASRDNGIG